MNKSLINHYNVMYKQVYNRMIFATLQLAWEYKVSRSRGE